MGENSSLSRSLSGWGVLKQGEVLRSDWKGVCQRTVADNVTTRDS